MSGITDFRSMTGVYFVRASSFLSVTRVTSVFSLASVMSVMSIISATNLKNGF